MHRNFSTTDADMEHVMADKAYGSDTLLDQVHAQGATVVIPPRRNRSET